MARKGPGEREVWGSQLGFVLAAIGSAIGLGNIWRFSYMAYENGGGAFLVPYFIALITAGIPLMILEFGIGHQHIGSAPLAFAKISRHWEWLGWWAVLFVMFGIVLYYTVVIAWCLNYAVLALSLGWGGDPDTFFFKEFLGVSKGPSEVGTIRMPILAGLVVVWILNWIIVYQGVRRGIELANKIFMPLLFVLTAILVIWALSLEGAGAGLRAYLMPDFSVLTKPRVWIDAFSQIFFTLSLGFGIMIAYASYLPRKANLTRNAYIASLVNCGYSVFAGFSVFALLGHMAREQNVAIKDVVSQSIGLAFVAYPKAISLLPGGSVFGVLFFLSLVVAGISSSVSILEAFTSAAVDKFGWERKQVVTIISVVGLMGGLVFASQGGLFWLDIVDHFLTHFGLVVVGLLEAILVGWVLQIEGLRKHINAVSDLKLGPWWTFLVKFFVPAILIAILVGDVIHELGTPYGDYSWRVLVFIGLDWLAVTLLGALIFTMRPWRHRLDGH